MAISQKRSNRKPTGARYKSVYKEKLYELGSDATLTKLGAKRTRKLRVMGNNPKMRLLSAESANVLDPKTKKIWIVHPAKVELKKNPIIKLDWEHTEYKWIKPENIKKFDIVYNLDESLKRGLL